MNVADIELQDRALKFLVKSLKNGRLANAYLFVGPEGTGKEETAKKIAKILNCQDREFDSCTQCSSCRKIDNFNHPDIHWIKREASNSIKIEDIRELEKDIYLRPYEARKKVYIIQDAERMTEESSNALLKTLEEPPLNSVLILITAHSNRILPTIASRCQKIYFSPFSKEALEQILLREYTLDKSKSHFLSRFSAGKLGQALRFKDVDVLKERDNVINNFVYSSDFNKFSANLKSDSKKDIEDMLDILINWYRDILLVKLGFDNMELVNADRIDDLMSLKTEYSFDDLFEIIELIIKINSLAKININIKVALTQLKERICKQ